MEKIKSCVANPVILTTYAKKKALKFITLSEKRTVVLEFLKEHMVGKQITIKGYSAKVELTWPGLKNDVSHHHANNTSKLFSFVAIDRILENASYIGSEPDKRSRHGIVFHKFVSKVKIKKNSFDVFIYVKQSNKTSIYDHVLFLE